MVWMPAHTSGAQVGCLRLSNGELLTRTDRLSNDEADKLAKAAAREGRVPLVIREGIQRELERLTAIATWVGQATALANEFKVDGVKGALRDSAPREKARQRRSGKSPKGKPVRTPSPVPLVDRGLPQCARWHALRERLLAKSCARAASGAGAL